MKTVFCAVFEFRADRVTPGFVKKLFESDTDYIMENVAYALDGFSCLQTADIQSVVSGPITYTSDILPMVGPVPEMENYWCAFRLWSYTCSY